MDTQTFSNWAAEQALEKLRTLILLLFGGAPWPVEPAALEALNQKAWVTHFLLEKTLLLPPPHGR